MSRELQAAFFIEGVLAVGLSGTLAFIFWRRWQDRLMMAFSFFFLLVGLSHALACFGSMVGGYTHGMALLARGIQILGLLQLLVVLILNSFGMIGVPRKT